MLVKNIKSLKSTCLFCCLALSVQGCMCMPTCSSPPFPAATTYPGQDCVQIGTNIRQFGWRDFFTDPTLQCLITLALNHNRDVQGARLQVIAGPTSLVAIEQQKAACNRVIGEVANAYLVAGELNDLICNSQKTIKNRQEGYCIMKTRLEEGAVAEFDFLQAKTLLQEAKIELEALELRRELNWNALMLLVGVPICPIDQSLCQIEPCLMTEICPGLPAELLCNRPDVRAAKLSLSQTEYERTIQVAYREVADALAQRDLHAEQICQQKELLDTQTVRAKIAWTRFFESTSSFLEVLDAEREKFSAEQAYVQTRRLLLASEINLYVALGGGCN